MADSPQQIDWRTGKPLDTSNFTPGGAGFNPAGAISGVVADPFGAVRKATDKLGVTHPDPADLSKSPDANALRGFSQQLVQEYNNRQPTAFNDYGLTGVANGTKSTAADALLQKGADTAARTAIGTAAAYGGTNPLLALRGAQAAGVDAGNKAASDAAMLKAKEQQDAAQALLTGNQTQQEINNQREAAMRSAAESGLVAPLQADQAAAQIKAQNDAANATFWGSALGTVGQIASRPSAPAPTASDARLKTDIRDGSRDADAFLSSLAPRSYEWKDPGNPITTGPGEHLGVIAQEMRPRDTVEVGGTKFISPEVVSSMLAGLGRINERLAAVEKGKKGDEGVIWGPNPYPAPEPPGKPIVLPERRRG